MTAAMTQVPVPTATVKANEWRHLIRDYVRNVIERPELQEDEVFRYSMAG